jgi:hypothetical protein
LKNERKKTDETFREALTKSYIARAKLFYTTIKGKNIANLVSRIKSLSAEDIRWNFSELCIDKDAFNLISKSAINPLHIFCHPQVLSSHPDLIEYYRNLAAVSKKGFSQILSGKLVRTNSVERMQTIARTLNKIISSAIKDATKGFSLSFAQEVMLAEIGAEVQGTWVNKIGQGAARSVENIIQSYANVKGFVSATETRKVVIRNKKRKQTHLILKNGWRIIFAPEPDIAIRNSKHKLQVAIEIKGSMDKAGAQTRLGEAKKSFAKAKAENAHCLTMYLASCYTDAVMEQLKTEREIDRHFNLVDILYDEEKKKEFLEELFHYQIRIE